LKQGETNLKLQGNQRQENGKTLNSQRSVQRDQNGRKQLKVSSTLAHLHVNLNVVKNDGSN